MRGRRRRRWAPMLRRAPRGATPHPARLRLATFPARGKGRAPFLIYDPVMIASSGDALAGAGFVEAVKARLLPLVDCLTPNLAEAAALLGAPLAQRRSRNGAPGRGAARSSARAPC